MAQPQAQAQQQRPPFQPQQSFPQNYHQPNGRPAQFSPQSPQMPTTYSSPSPQQFSPTYGQAPPSKRQRLSPDASSPYPSISLPPAGTPQSVSPTLNGQQPANGVEQSLSRPGSMAPPQRPLEKDERDRDYDNVFKNTGIDLEEETRNLQSYGQSNARTSAPPGPDSIDHQSSSSFSNRPASNAGTEKAEGLISDDLPTPISSDDKVRREEERLDWEAGRHSQHELWDPFLYGGTLNDKIKSFSQKANLIDPQSGVLVNTQKNAPPPTVRVNGLEGASRVISNGQSILDTKEKAERLSEIIKLLSLSAKSRLTGILQTSARLSLERREYSKGRVPDEWANLAAPLDAAKDDTTQSRDPAQNSGIKRSHSAMVSEIPSRQTTPASIAPAIEAFEKSSNSARSAEDVRAARRAKRKSTNPSQEGEAAAVEQDVLLAGAMDPEKKTTKKERKMAESKISERQQHASANEAARMATAGLIGGRFGGKKSKNYAWMTGGASGGSSTVGTPGRTTGTPAATPGKESGASASRGRRFAAWDEDRDPGIQAKDILLVLESDGQAARSLVKSVSALDA